MTTLSTYLLCAAFMLITLVLCLIIIKANEKPNTEGMRKFEDNNKKKTL